ncbi:hypothetical protein NKT34_25710 [Paenibacillus polysaccharolyticus]|uniref:hypothetical protein n=1 Tax=Paenibacillus polysaccharolyticus TaxID=582692 RepID=UPI00209CDF4C|nr:hypothetical protein [Paenibacillus polysaccharolyticus]MCP1136670.1 hypothetical protein [Paenibacillus polysaccharolyticus]
MKNTKKFVAGILSLSFLLSAVPAGASSAEVSPQDNQSITSNYQQQLKVSTPEEYIAFLKAKNTPQVNTFSIASTEAVGENNDLANFIGEYTSLPYDKQQKVVDYFNDPEFLNTLVSAQTFEGEESKSFYGGDLVVTNKLVSITPESVGTLSVLPSGGFTTMAVGDTKEHGKAYEAITTLFGIDFVKTRLELSIQTKEVKTNASQITKVLTERALIVQNYSPGDIKKNQYATVVNSAKTTAKLETDWQWDFLWSGFGLTVGTKRQWLQLDKAGKATYNTYNL